MRHILLGLLIVLILLLAGFRLAAGWRESDTPDALRPADGRLVATPLGAIHVLDLGPRDGKALLFLHGAAAWSGLWRPVLEGLATEGYRAIGIDLPPFGFSERDPAARYDRTRQAERILALTEAMAVRPVLVAHSFGAGPGVEAAMMGPDRFSGLVVVDGALGIGTEAGDKALPLWLRPEALREVIVSASVTNPLMTRRLLASLLYVKEAASDEAVGILQRPMRLTGSTEAFAAWLPSLLLPPADALSTQEASYRALCLPTAFIWGDKDSVTPLPQGQHAAGLVRGATLTVLPEVGHIPQIEAPEAFEAALRQALDALPQEGCPADG